MLLLCSCLKSASFDIFKVVLNRNNFIQACSIRIFKKSTTIRVSLHEPESSSMLQPISKAEFTSIFWPASMHAIGHIAANLSFAAVAISLTHTVKTMEPVFSVVLSKLLLGQNTPAPVLATLVPIMVSLTYPIEISCCRRTRKKWGGGCCCHTFLGGGK